MPEPAEHGEAQPDVGRHGQGGELERRSGVLMGEEGRRKHLHQHQGRQSDGERLQGERAHGHIRRPHLPMVEDGGNQRLRQQVQRHRRRQPQQQAHAQAPAQGPGEGRAIALLGQPRQIRQQHRAQSHGHQADGQFQQPIRVIQPGDAADRQRRSQHGVDERVQLAGRGGQRGRRQQPPHLPHPLVADADPGTGQQMQPRQKGRLKQQLQNPGGEQAPSQGERHVGAGQGGQNHGADQGGVQQHGREGRRRVAVVDVEDGAGEGGQGDEAQIGEGDAQQVGGQPELLRIVPEARREQPDQRFGETRPGQHDSQQRQTEIAAGEGDELLQFRHAPGLVAGQHRHERLAERPFGEQAPEEVGDAEGDEEGVGHPAGAQEMGQQHIPREPGDARQQRHGTDQGAFGGHVGALLVRGRGMRGLGHGVSRKALPRGCSRGENSRMRVFRQRMMRGECRRARRGRKPEHR